MVVVESVAAAEPVVEAAVESGAAVVAELVPVGAVVGD